MKEEQVRAFIAIELSSALKEGLGRLQDRLKEGQGSVKWVNPGGLHLTLKFLGNIPAGRVPEIVRAMGEGARGVSLFHLEFGGWGGFPSLGAPRVAWVGVGGEVEGLIALQKGIDRALALVGFAEEARPFSPHLTLGRVREGAPAAEKRRLGEALARLRAEGLPSLDVEAVSLMRSKLTPSGALYSRLAEVTLGDPLPKALA